MGVGYMLLQWGCNMADNYSRNSFVMASPDGVLLYSRFDFKAVGEVWIELVCFGNQDR
jgi:hypothetical protein